MTTQRSICIEWNIEDVQGEALEKFNRTISDSDAYIVLQFLVKAHDAAIGINWDVIYCAIETLSQRKEITLLEV